ncbi:MAG: hypothetical protein ACREP6_03135 [Candidatus Binataceae bacterium]
MALLRRPERFRFIAAALAIILFAGSLPVVTGIILMPNSPPAFTLDICHPLQSFDAPSNVSLAPLNAPCVFTVLLHDRGVAPEASFGFAARPGDTPDPPPPRSPA